MDPQTILLITDAALTLLEKLAPELEAAVQTGTITIEQQKAIFARVNNLRMGGTGFSGPEWKPSSPS